MWTIGAETSSGQIQLHNGGVLNSLVVAVVFISRQSVRIKSELRAVSMETRQIQSKSKQQPPYYYYYFSFFFVMFFVINSPTLNLHIMLQQKENFNLKKNRIKIKFKKINEIHSDK